jgi:transposase-like protein
MKLKLNYYSETFKDQVVTAYSNGNESLRVIAQRFGIKRYTLHDWVYHRSESSKAKKSSNLASSNSAAMEKEELPVSELKALILKLEKDLSVEKMRSESLSKMIDIAEGEFQISIRKKSGAKQSLK